MQSCAITASRSASGITWENFKFGFSELIGPAEAGIGDGDCKRRWLAIDIATSLSPALASYRSTRAGKPSQGCRGQIRRPPAGGAQCFGQRQTLDRPAITATAQTELHAFQE